MLSEIQAITLSEGGETMLLSGLSLRVAQNPNAEIAITCTGLLPGEKLYGEPLIDAESEPTEHPLIFRGQEEQRAPIS